MTCWRTTFLAIRLSIWPQKNGATGRFPDYTVLNASQVATTNQPTDTADNNLNQQLHVRIEDCHHLAAPFVLFRLKRTGFSACRVVYENDGLTIYARR